MPRGTPAYSTGSSLSEGLHCRSATVTVTCPWTGLKLFGVGTSSP